MVIVGTKIKNFSDKEVRLRYFIGIYKKNKNGKTVDLQSIDPDVINVEGVTPDEDFHTFDDVVGMVEQEKYVIEDITPEFVAPVVALVQNNKIYNPIRSEILKAYETIYTKNRKEEIATTEYFKKLKLQAALRGMISDVNDHFDKNDWHETLTAKQIKAFGSASVISPSMPNDAVQPPEVGLVSITTYGNLASLTICTAIVVFGKA